MNFTIRKRVRYSQEVLCFTELLTSCECKAVLFIFVYLLPRFTSILIENVKCSCSPTQLKCISIYQYLMLLLYSALEGDEQLCFNTAMNLCILLAARLKEGKKV